METFDYVLNVVIGMVIIPLVTQGIKNWLKVVNPLLKLSIVLALSAGAGIGLAKLYIPEMTANDAIASALVIAIAAVTGKVTHKGLTVAKGG